MEELSPIAPRRPSPILIAGLFLASLGLVSASYYADAHSDAPLSPKIPIPAQEEIISTDDPRVIQIGNAVIRLASGGRAQLEAKKETEVELLEGRLWLNASASAMPVRITSGPAAVEVLGATVDLQRVNETLAISQIRGSAYIEVARRRLVISAGEAITVPLTKVIENNDSLASIAYSKLQKEFPPEPSYGDKWTDYNEREDAQWRAAHGASVAARVRARGTGGANVSSSLARLADVVTLSASKKRERAFRASEKLILAALNQSLQGDGDASRTYELFEHAAESHRALGGLRSEYLPLLDSVFYARDERSEPFAAARDSLMRVAIEDPAASLAMGLDDVSEAFSGSDALAAGELGSARLRRLIKELSSRPEGQADSERMLLNLVVLNKLLATYSALGREEFLSFAGAVEDRELAGVTAKEDEVDLRQFFISEKLALLRVIRSWLEKDLVPFQAGRASALALARRIEELRPLLVDTAFVALFDEELSREAQFLAFLRSSPAATMRGSFDDHFADFKSQSDEIAEVRKLLESAQGGTGISAGRKEELAAQVQEDAATVPLSEIKIMLPNVEETTAVKIVEARFEGKSFAATYDIARKLFTEITFDGRQFPYGVRQENLNRFLLVSMGALKLQSGQSIESIAETAPSQTTVQKVAVARIIGDLAKIGIRVDPHYLGFEDFKNGIVHVRLATHGEGSQSHLFSFDLTEKFSSAINVRVQTVAGELPLNGQFNVLELPSKVEQIYARAVFEKEREVEEKISDQQRPQE